MPLRLVTLLLCLLPRLIHAQETPMLLLYAPALSPDGKSFAFEWDDDIWLASSDSGEAKRIIDTPGRDMFPRITPDGKRIVFTSDRSGSPQVYSCPVAGGPATQHTFHTEGSQLECLSPDGCRALVRGMRERSGYKPWRLMEIDLTRPSREIRLFDASAHTPAWSPDGKQILFCRGGELPYRKGFHGSRASRIWSFEKSTRMFTLEILGDHEARSPLWLPDGSGFYYVSNETGTANLWLRKSDASPIPITSYQTGDILTPALSHDGSTLIFRRGFDLVRIDPKNPGKTHTFHAFTRETPADRSTETIPITGCQHADLSPDLSHLVFSEAGELWLVPQAGDKPVRLTNTPSAEEFPRYSPDGRWLYFLSDNGLTSDICRARIIDHALAEMATLHSGNASKSNLTPSPCGKLIAWIEARGDLRVADADGSHPRTVWPCWNKPSFSWSPDGRWLAVATQDAHANRDIHLVSSAAGSPAVNLTRHPAYDGAPEWSPDGRRIVFTSKRGQSGDAQLWCIDFGAAGIGENPATDWLHRRADAAKALPTRGLEPRRVVWCQEPHRLYFQSRSPSETKLYQLDAKEGEVTVLSETNGIPIRVMADGSLLWRVDRTPQLFRKKDPVMFPIATSMQRSRPDFLKLGFRRIWRLLGERFHDPGMNGNDWEEIRTAYEPVAAAARTSREFDHIIGRLLGELNASHLVFQREPWRDEYIPKKPHSETLYPGIRFHEPSGIPNTPLTIQAPTYGAPAFLGVVASAKSPAGTLPDTSPKPGETVLRIAGQAVDDSTPLEPLFTGSHGMQVPIVLRDAHGTERTTALTCVSFAEARKLDAERWESRCIQRAGEKGIAYIHLKNMSRDSLQKLELFVHRSAHTHKALLLDLRNNGGGREANRMLSIFEQQTPFLTRPRNGPEGYPHDRLSTIPWPHPVAVLCNENTYSNSEIFCHAFRSINRGPLVGTVTAGGVISAIMTDVPGLGKLQIPFRTWMDPKSQHSLDNNGAQPTHAIPLTPADEDGNIDPQLQKAIELLR